MRGLGAEAYLEFAGLGKQGGNRSHGRVKRQESEGSESVDEKPKSHASRNTSR
jgi:hypothetical protein